MEEKVIRIIAEQLSCNVEDVSQDEDAEKLQTVEDVISLVKRLSLG